MLYGMSLLQPSILTYNGGYVVSNPINTHQLMTRLLENRILGGVCSGLGRSTPISAWLWRIIWLLLVPLTGGTAILLYAMWWWVLPEQSFNDVEVGRFLPSIAVIALSAVVIGGWFVRDTLVSDTGVNLYLPLMVLLTALVFLSQQFDRHKLARNNPILGIVFVLVSGFWLVGALGTLPSGMVDTMSRALPAVLIFFGLSLILRERIPLGSVIALVVSLVIPLGIATVAFSGRVGQVLDDNVVQVSQPIEDDASQLILDLSALNADVEILTGTEAGVVEAEFVGSTEHTLEAAFGIDEQGIATLVLDEVQESTFPTLAGIGRGTIDVQLPRNLPIFLKLDVEDGDVTLNLRDLDLESIETLSVDNGNVLITLPAYQSLSPSAQDSGILNVLGGNLTLLIPENLGAELFLNQATNRRPEFDDLLYLLEDRGSEWRLLPREFDSLPIKTSYIISVPSGSVRVDVSE